MKHHRLTLLAAGCALALFVAPAAPGVASAAAAERPVNASTFGRVAIAGYDPVAYFTEGQPAEGKKQFSHEWNGAVWRFASAAHRDLFKADPVKYAPQYGGYCAWAVSQGDTAGIDPAAWFIVEGRLYRNYSKKVQERWQQDVPGHLARGNANWPKLIDAKP